MPETDHLTRAAEVRTMRDAVTTIPWKTHPTKDARKFCICEDGPHGEDGDIAYAWGRTDASFIAAAPDLATELADALEALAKAEAENERLRDILREVKVRLTGARQTNTLNRSWFSVEEEMRAALKEPTDAEI